MAQIEEDGNLVWQQAISQNMGGGKQHREPPWCLEVVCDQTTSVGMWIVLRDQWCPLLARSRAALVYTQCTTLSGKGPGNSANLAYLSNQWRSASGSI